jgi:hypothetical protein
VPRRVASSVNNAFERMEAAVEAAGVLGNCARSRLEPVLAPEETKSNVDGGRAPRPAPLCPLAERLEALAERLEFATQGINAVLRRVEL